MKHRLYLIACVACVIFVLTACGKQKETHHSDITPPGKLDSSWNSFTKELPQQILSKEEFDDPSAGYYHAYLLTQRTEELTNPEESIRKLQEALRYFRAMKKRRPDWKTAMVDARTQSTEESLNRLSKTNR